jgi:hypothetical protein
MCLKLRAVVGPKSCRDAEIGERLHDGLRNFAGGRIMVLSMNNGPAR